MGLKWYHILLFTAVIVVAAYFAIPTDTQMGVLEARSGKFDSSRDYLLTSIRNRSADWADIQEYIKATGLLYQHNESVHVLTNYLALHPENQQARHTLIDALIANRQLPEAINYLETEPERTRADNLHLAKLYEMAGRIDDAIALLQVQLNGSTDDYEILKTIVRYQRWRQYVFAEADSLEKMYTMRPDDSTLERLLDIYTWQGKLKPSLKAALEVKNSRTTSAQLLRKARTVFISAGDAPDALALAQRICQQPSALPDDFMVFAQLSDWTGSTDQAVATLQQGLERYPENLAMLRFLASLLFKTQQIQTAADIYEQLAKSTRRPQDWYYAAVMNRDAGHLEKAIDMVKKAGETPEVLRLKATLAYETGDTSTASNTVMQILSSGATNLAADVAYQLQQAAGTNNAAALQIIPTDPVDLLAAQARLAAQQGEYPRAEKLFREYLEERPEDGWGWYELGEVIFNAGGNGLPDMRKALDYLPINGTAQRYALHAGIRDREGRAGEAERLYQDAVQADTNAVDVICDYADFLITHRKLATARRLLEDTRARFPDYLRLQRLYALLLIEQGQYQQALNLLRELYQLHPNDYELEGDLAYAEDVNGHWKNAIQLFRRAAQKSSAIPREADRTAAFRRRELELRKQYYPQLLYTYIQQHSNEEDIRTQVGGARAFLTEKLCLKLRLEEQRFVYEPAEDALRDTADITLAELATEARITDWLTPRLALLRYRVNQQDYNGFGAAIAYSPRPKTGTQFQYLNHYPWLDNIFSLVNAGYFNEWAASIYMREIPYFGLLAQYQRRDYTLDLNNVYAGQSDELYARIEYELLFAPDRTYGIGFAEPRMRYDDSMNLALLPYFAYNYKQHNVPAGFNQVPVTERTSNYRLGIDWFQPINAAWGAHAGAYVGADPDRDISFGNLYGFRAKIMYIVRRRTRLWAMYESSSENLSGLEDGETQYWYIGANHIF
jgi:tetratricopeptide (TPR) repeat protein